MTCCVCVFVCLFVYYSLLMPFPWKHSFHICTQVAALYSHRLADTGVTLYCFSEKGGKNTKEITSLNFSWQFSFGEGGGHVRCMQLLLLIGEGMIWCEGISFHDCRN
jgi:hypothetical protein